MKKQRRRLLVSDIYELYVTGKCSIMKNVRDISLFTPQHYSYCGLRVTFHDYAIYYFEIQSWEKSDLLPIVKQVNAYIKKQGGE